MTLVKYTRPLTFVLALIFVTIPFISTSSVLTLSLNGQDVSGKTITIEGKKSDEMIKASFVITNTSGKALQVKVRKTEILTVPGTLNAFCLGECFPPAVLESPNPLQVAANSSTPKDLFYAEYYPSGLSGTSEIKYEVIDVSNSANTISVVIRFDARDITNSTLFPAKDPEFHIYPNPLHNGQCAITIPELPAQSPARLVISDQKGCIESKIIPPDQGSRIILNLEEKSNGIYTLSIFSGIKLIYTEKLMIIRNK
jgi:hypothetical protein